MYTLRINFIEEHEVKSILDANEILHDYQKITASSLLRDGDIIFILDIHTRKWLPICSPFLKRSDWITLYYEQDKRTFASIARELKISRQAVREHYLKSKALRGNSEEKAKY